MSSNKSIRTSTPKSSLHHHRVRLRREQSVSSSVSPPPIKNRRKGLPPSAREPKGAKEPPHGRRRSPSKAKRRPDRRSPSPPLKARPDLAWDDLLRIGSKSQLKKAKPPSHHTIRMRWTDEEVQALTEATIKYGPGKWALIKKATGNIRSTVQLKDKWRSIQSCSSSKAASRDRRSPSPRPHRHQESRKALAPDSFEQNSSLEIIFSSSSESSVCLVTPSPRRSRKTKH